MGRQPIPPPAKNSGCLAVAGFLFVLFLMLLVFVVAATHK